VISVGIALLVGSTDRVQVSYGLSPALRPDPNPAVDNLRASNDHRCIRAS